MVNSQHTTAPQSDRKCDIVIRYLEQGTQKIRVLCFAECKRTRTSQTFSLKALEKQANEYCRLCLDSEDDMRFVYAATMAGAHIRLWTCFRDQSNLVLTSGVRPLSLLKEGSLTTLFLHHDGLCEDGNAAAPRFRKWRIKPDTPNRGGRR
jgi:hypothetical protein